MLETFFPGLSARQQHRAKCSSSGNTQSHPTQHQDTQSLLAVCRALCLELSSWPPSLPPSQRVVLVSANAGHPEVAAVMARACGRIGWLVVVEEENSSEEEEKKEKESSNNKDEMRSGVKMMRAWNLLWSWAARPKVTYAELLSWQRVNHYPGAKSLTSKAQLKQRLASCSLLRPLTRPFDNVSPPTFRLPLEWVAFAAAFDGTATEWGNNVWIAKPVGLSRGRGIALVADVMGVEYGAPYVVQRYISSPLLVEGYKFDLRLYVVVTSFSPLEAFIYKEGFARFSTVPYTLDDLSNLYIHLTNSAVQNERLASDPTAKLPPFLPQQQQHQLHVPTTDTTSPPSYDSLYGGSKCCLKHVFTLLEESHHPITIDTTTLWERIVSDVVLKSLFAAQEASPNIIPNQPNSFELFGYDAVAD
eukprot:jgi/Chlat1/7068/Chrsp57S06771